MARPSRSGSARSDPKAGKTPGAIRRISPSRLCPGKAEPASCAEKALARRVLGCRRRLVGARGKGSAPSSFAMGAHGFLPARVPANGPSQPQLLAGPGTGSCGAAAGGGKAATVDDAAISRCTDTHPMSRCCCIA